MHNVTEDTLQEKSIGVIYWKEKLCLFYIFWYYWLSFVHLRLTLQEFLRAGELYLNVYTSCKPVFRTEMVGLHSSEDPPPGLMIGNGQFTWTVLWWSIDPLYVDCWCPRIDISNHLFIQICCHLFTCTAKCRSSTSPSPPNPSSSPSPNRQRWSSLHTDRRWLLHTHWIMSICPGLTQKLLSKFDHAFATLNFLIVWFADYP